MKYRAWALLGCIVYRVGGIVALPIWLNGTTRTRVAMIDRTTSEILLAKVWIGTQKWGLIGGGIDADEDLIVAAIREVKEETGFSLDQSQLVYVADKHNREYMARYKTHIFIALVDRFEPTQARIEILDMKWHKLADLPDYRHDETIMLVKNKLARI